MSLYSKQFLKLTTILRNDTIYLSKILTKIDSSIIAIVLYTLFLYFSGYLDSSNQNLTAHDEGLYVGRAKLILSSDNWFTPFDSSHHKLVGSYWLIAASIKFLGFSEFSARLPSGFFSTLCSILVFYIGSRLLI